MAGIVSEVCAVILNWNRWRDTVACVESVRRQGFASLEILVVDNGSSDDSEARMREKLPDIEMIQSGRNLGFGGGCNIGIRRAIQRGAKYVWLLNNDATVSPETLTDMVTVAEDNPALGAIGAVIFSANSSGRLECWGGGQVNLWLARTSNNLAKGRVDYLTGACLLLRVDALKEVGLFDDKNFFMYWEDVDLCLRLSRAKWGLGVAANTRVEHAVSSSLGQRSPLADRYATRSAIHFACKHSPLPALTMIVLVSLRLGRRILIADWNRVRAVWQGVRDAHFGRRGESDR